jgi:hypothetical protein
MLRFVILAAVVGAPLACWHLCTKLFHMHGEEAFSHIVIAIMAVGVHKLVELKSGWYRRTELSLRRRATVFVGRLWQFSRRIVGAVRAGIVASYLRGRAFGGRVATAIRDGVGRAAAGMWRRITTFERRARRRTVVAWGRTWQAIRRPRKKDESTVER